MLCLVVVSEVFPKGLPKAFLKDYPEVSQDFHGCRVGGNPNGLCRRDDEAP
jgi:hypothetical protein